MKNPESQIVYERPPFWVCRADGQYTVYKNTITHAIADSSYADNKDGLSIAKVRCNYLANRCG